MLKRVSNTPNGKQNSKSKHAKSNRGQKSGTEASDSLVSYPLSTNVSSPLRGASRRRKPQKVDFEEHASETGDDSFVVDDGEESDDSAFLPVRDSRLPYKSDRNVSSRRSLGPPIRSNGLIDGVNLNRIHREVVNNFVREAKQIEEDMRNQKGIRKPLFKDNDFTQMGYKWTTSKESMLAIDGIDKSKVLDYGDKFLPVIKRYHKFYDDAMAKQADHDRDINHRNVIDLISEAEDGVDDEDEYGGIDDDDVTGEVSKHFDQPVAQREEPFKPPSNDEDDDASEDQYHEYFAPPSDHTRRSGFSTHRDRDDGWNKRRSSGVRAVHNTSRSTSGGRASGSGGSMPALNKPGVRKRVSGDKRSSAPNVSTTARNAKTNVFPASARGGSVGKSLNSYFYQPMPT
jgi:bloom syndrome protein